MCTVSFIPADGRVFITSNRDESAERPLALAPSLQKLGSHSFLGPKDALAGGTWIALRNDGSAQVLLNGAFEKHSQQPAYRKSRGQIFWDVFATDYPLTTFDRIPLWDIEPFMLVLWQKGELHEMRWDGKVKTQVKKDAGTAHIWSSCTLYTAGIRIYRENLFRQWLATQTKHSVETIHRFHLYTDPAGEAEKNIRINRKGEMLTVSVSCMEISQRKSTFHYSDLVRVKNYSLPL
ncbi:MAG TPA: NRDE family protein [Puia sp.]|jgi:uncharacterized protein with NRDE domain|nr:NRDE family protein [Puia sp.]